MGVRISVYRDQECEDDCLPLIAEGCAGFFYIIEGFVSEWLLRLFVVHSLLFFIVAAPLTRA